MLDAYTIDIPVHLARAPSGAVALRQGPRPEPVPPPVRIPRIARLLALALRFEGLVRRGEVDGYADLARLGHVTRARISQIMDLVNLAPDIVEEILFMTVAGAERDPFTERDLRSIVRHADWARQREVWRAMVTERPASAGI
ncbi:MAG TPA: hypothetical protein VHC70_08350 [Phycisphaerales bacterium]|nr:hypothetical protein [Phycisphaerales bacterium]